MADELLNCCDDCDNCDVIDQCAGDPRLLEAEEFTLQRKFVYISIMPGIKDTEYCPENSFRFVGGGWFQFANRPRDVCQWAETANPGDIFRDDLGMYVCTCVWRVYE